MESNENSSSGLNPTTLSREPEDDEAIEAISRYEDFATVDWIQDANMERSRRHKLMNSLDSSWKSWLWLSYEAGQAWIVALLVGCTVGLNAALINIISEWLSDVKLGYCSTGWWLNQKFCCWEVENEIGSCDDWYDWSMRLNFPRDMLFINLVFYILFASLFAFVAAFLVKSYAPYAAGSGISEIKVILGGFVIKGFLGLWTLIIKSLGVAMVVASGISVGKEGPAVHIACCVGNVISRNFSKFKDNKARKREILSAASAAGVAVAFGSPIGGVLFSLEEISTFFPLKTLWRTFFCALVATVTLQAINPFRTGKLVIFEVTYNRDWQFFEIFSFIFLGVFGGLYGAFLTKMNLIVATYRRKYLRDYGVQEATFLAFITAVIGYFNIFLRIDMSEMMSILFKECEEGDYYGLCKRPQTASVMNLLFWATVLRIGLCIISYGAKVPCGIFVPSMAIGACFGRFVGMGVQALHHNYPSWPIFSTCPTDVPCITPGTYSFLGAAAALCGVTKMTVSLVVIMFELTGALNYILPTMITVMVTKAVGDLFMTGGIADQMIKLNGFPFLDKEDHLFGISVSQVMVRDQTVFTSTGMRLENIEQILDECGYSGFPVVEDRKNMKLTGFISRSELKYAIDKAKRTRAISPSAYCFFSTEDQNTPTVEGNSSSFIDFGPWIDQTPFTVHPKLPLETAMDLFKKMGPRAILVELNGKLIGLLTKKDVLRAVHSKPVKDPLLPSRPEFHRGMSGDSNSGHYFSDSEVELDTLVRR
ncbi:glycerol ethanol, ferric requiring protein [Basidiobolus ranarum]|uniref:Chloride channel protein n=1 Tax=Basidiobolus ranarum TaxID=34480 RepID=A0ABR2VW69_9FUNG